MPPKRRASVNTKPKPKPRVGKAPPKPSEAIQALFPAITHPRKLIYLEAYILTGTQKAAMRAVPFTMSPQILLAWQWLDPAFVEAEEVARKYISLQFQDDLFDRVLHGVDREVWFLGERVGTEKRHSDRLLLQALASWQPERYGRVQKNIHEVSPAMQALLDTWTPVTPGLPLSLGEGKPPWEDAEGDEDEDEDAEEREDEDDDREEE